MIVRFKPICTDTGTPSTSMLVLPVKYQPSDPVENSLTSANNGSPLITTVTGLAAARNCRRLIGQVDFGGIGWHRELRTARARLIVQVYNLCSESGCWPEYRESGFRSSVILASWLLIMKRIPSSPCGWFRGKDSVGEIRREIAAGALDSVLMFYYFMKS
jgi:hypothetical protein